MGFWVFMLTVCLLIPLTMVGLGRYFLKRPPKEINAAFGCRTVRSMQNQDTWDFAHRACGRLWFRWGLALLPTAVLAMLAGLGKTADKVGLLGLAVCAAQMVPFTGAVFTVERALKRTFDKDGRRKES